MPSKPSERRVIMAKKVAADWLANNASAEYRFRVYHNADAGVFVNLLRGFRDNRVKLAGVDPIPDLGLKNEVSGFTIWSSDWSALQSLKTFLEKRGMDTSWIW